MIAGNAEEWRPLLDLQLVHQRVEDIEHVVFAFGYGAGIIDVAEVDDGIDLERLERLAQQRDVVAHMRAPVAEHEHFAGRRQRPGDGAERYSLRLVLVPVAVGRRRMRGDVIFDVVQQALRPAEHSSVL